MQEMIPSAEQQAQSMAMKQQIYAIVDGQDVNIALNSLVHALAMLISDVAEDPRQSARDCAAQLVTCTAAIVAKKQSGRLN